MHYYQFNIGDYASSTQHLEPLEDLAYRRMLDLYYQKECPLPNDVQQIARLIRMRSHCDCIEVVLQEFFELSDDGYRNKGADKVLKKTYDKSESARRSAKARWDKKQDKKQDVDANAMRTQCENNADGMLPNTQYPIPNNKDLVAEQRRKFKFDADRIIPIWNSLGCRKHKGLTQKAEKALKKTYEHYCKNTKEPKELNDWLEAYLRKGFGGWMSDHHRELGDGKWSADLEFAVRLDTYDKVKNTVTQ